MPGAPSAGGLLFHVITSLTIPPDYLGPYHQGARSQLRRGEEVCSLVEKRTTLRPRACPADMIEATATAGPGEQAIKRRKNGRAIASSEPTPLVTVM